MHGKLTKPKTSWLYMTFLIEVDNPRLASTRNLYLSVAGRRTFSHSAATAAGVRPSRSTAKFMSRI